MKTKQQPRTYQQTRSRRERPRYYVSVEGPQGKREDIGMGSDLAAEIAFAKRHHGGRKTWVWDVHTGKMLHEIPRAVLKASAGGAF